MITTLGTRVESKDTTPCATDSRSMDSAPTLDDAILFAAQKHHGKRDKVGPYILHVLSVMFRLGSDEERMAGVLHDIVEETDVTLEQLKELGYPDRIVEAIDLLTWRKEQESYEQHIQRLKPNPLAASVKRADLEDHLTPIIGGGGTWLEENYPNLYERYQKALQELGQRSSNPTRSAEVWY